jgi:hypothetical protein
MNNDLAFEKTGVKTDEKMNIILTNKMSMLMR